MKRFFTLLCIACLFLQAYAWKPLFAGHRGSYRGVENTEEAMMNGINYYAPVKRLKFLSVYDVS